MKSRCYDPNNKDYKNYGGRGIIVHPEWIIDFKSFYDYIMSLENAAKPGLTLDRVKNDGNYEPDNLRWVSKRFQNINKRKRFNKYSQYSGITMNQGYYVATICVNHQHYYLGRYKIEIEAATARDKYIIDNELWEYPLQILNKP